MKHALPEEYDLLTRQHYQDAAVAQKYHAEFTGPWSLRTLPSRLIARRERRLIDRAIEFARAHGAVREVLDLPCGSGKLATIFAHHPFRVTAADISREMMEFAETEYRNVAGFAGFVQADATATNFPDAEFDAVVCLRLLHRVPDSVRQTIFQELSRVSGKYVIFSVGVTDAVQDIRRSLRHRTTGAASVPYPVTKEALAAQLSRAGLRPLRAMPVLPLLSSEWIVICEKQGL